MILHVSSTSVLIARSTEAFNLVLDKGLSISSEEEGRSYHLIRLRICVNQEVQMVFSWQAFYCPWPSSTRTIVPTKALT